MEQKLKNAHLDLINLPYPLNEEFERYQVELKRYYERRTELQMRKFYSRRFEGKRVRKRRIAQAGMREVTSAEKGLNITLKEYLNYQVLPKVKLKS